MVEVDEGLEDGLVAGSERCDEFRLIIARLGRSPSPCDAADARTSRRRAFARVVGVLRHLFGSAAYECGERCLQTLITFARVVRNNTVEREERLCFAPFIAVVTMCCMTVFGVASCL